MEEYHPAYGHRPVHDHHRRARRMLIGGGFLVVAGIIGFLWSKTQYWGDRQLEIARYGGVFMAVAGVVLLVVGTIVWFTIDDDEHPELPE